MITKLEREAEDPKILATQGPSKQQEVQEMRFNEAKVDEEEKKEVPKDATIGGNNHRTSFG